MMNLSENMCLLAEMLSLFLTKLEKIEPNIKIMVRRQDWDSK